MKKNTYILGLTLLLSITNWLSPKVFAQNFNTPLSYLSYIGQQQEEITKDYWDYINSIAHSTSARKVERRRYEIIKTTQVAINKISRMPDFKGDTSLRGSMLNYLKISHILLIEDYAKLIDLEEIAEQSYDAMEAYILAKEKAGEKLEEASAIVNQVVKKFASDNKINLIENEDKVSKKLTKSGLVFRYYNPIYLIFFKNYKQEMYLLDAINRNDLLAIEQNRNKLVEISSENIKSLDTLKAFKGDNSLKNACKQLLTFYYTEASTKITVINDFQLKKEKFDKIKTIIDNKVEMMRTKEDIDLYNNSLKEFNKSMNDYNRVNNELNINRNRLISSWNNAVGNFFSKYIPQK